MGILREIILFSFLAVLLVTLPAVFASNVSLHISKTNPVVFTGETGSVNAIIVNSQEKKDTFTLNIFNPLPNEITVSAGKFLVDLNSKEEGQVSLDFTPSLLATAQTVEFTVNVISTSDSSIKDSKSVFVNIKRKTPVFIRTLALGQYSLNPSEDVKIDTTIFNAEDSLSEKYFLTITVRKGTSVVQTFTEAVEAVGGRSSLTVSKSFKLDSYASPGGYVVETELRDVSNQLKDAKSANFNVNTVTQPPTEYMSKSTDYSVLFLFSTKIITVKNDGNVELPAFTVTESVPKFIQALFDPEIEPMSKDSSDNRIVYSWSVPALAPGEQYTISYKFAVWRVWAFLLVVGGVGYGAYKWISRPRVAKGVRHEGEIRRGKEILVLIEAKNRALHEIKDVEIVDVVPQIAKVVDRFDTLKPKTKKVTGSTELRWRFDSMKPMEERVLTYRIKPVVDVAGDLNLSEAQMFFVDKRKVKRSAVSKQALVKAGS